MTQLIIEAMKPILKLNQSELEQLILEVLKEIEPTQKMWNVKTGERPSPYAVQSARSGGSREAEMAQYDIARQVLYKLAMTRIPAKDLPPQSQETKKMSPAQLAAIADPSEQERLVRQQEKIIRVARKSIEAGRELFRKIGMDPKLADRLHKATVTRPEPKELTLEAEQLVMQLRDVTDDLGDVMVRYAKAGDAPGDVPALQLDKSETEDLGAMIRRKSSIETELQQLGYSSTDYNMYLHGPLEEINLQSTIYEAINNYINKS